MAKPERLVATLLVCGVLAALPFGCSWIKGDKAPAGKVASGARTVAVKTAKGGELVAKIIASGTYRGGRRAVTWTTARTTEGASATLQRLGLKERPVPPDLLERLPDELLEALTSLEFVKPQQETGKVVVSSPDSRWEGELFYSLAIGEQIEVALDGPAELIVVTLAAFRPPGKGEMPGEAAAFYKVHVSEDNETLGEVGFESSPPESLLALHGYPGWQVSSPGVFVIKSIEGSHIYRLNCKRADSDDFMLISFYIPRYEP